MIMCSALLAAALMNGCTGLASARNSNTTALAASPTSSSTPAITSAGYTTHGFTIPSSHPRLWWTPARIAQAQKWQNAHPVMCNSTDYLCLAFMHVVAGSDCSLAVNWAANTDQSMPVSGWPPSSSQTNPTAIGSDTMRTTAEIAYVVFDWCYNQWTLAQKTAFISANQTWVTNVDEQCWGGIAGGINHCPMSMTMDNYFLGNLRNDLEWGIVSYGDNGSGAGSNADSSIEAGINRWSAFKNDAASIPYGGGVPEEGIEYGVAFTYLVLPFQTMNLGGRDAYAETGFSKQMLYWLIYAITPSATVDNSSAGISAYQQFDFNDDEITANGGIFNQRLYWQNWLNFSSNYWSLTTNAGKYARLLYNNLTADVNTKTSYSYPADPWFVSVDNLPSAALSFSTLPLDFYATGMQYAYAKTAWDTTSTALMLQMGAGTNVGHQHSDIGNFTMWRGGYWVDRESTGYGDMITGTPNINNNANQNVSQVFAHNVPAFTNVALGQDSSPSYAMPTAQNGNATVNRLESQPEYFYADVDLTNRYLWDSDHSSLNTGVVGHIEREFIYVRSLETLVVLDRILTQNQIHDGALTAGNVVTSFLSHCETNPTIEDSQHFTCTDGSQVARQTILMPPSATYRVINERSCSGCDAHAGQYRIEVDNGGAAQRYSLNVIQSRASNGSNIAASVVDSNPSDPTSGTFNVTLHLSGSSDTTIIFNKSLCPSGSGQCASGGTINAAGAGIRNLRTNVQAISYSDSGIAWIP